MSAHALLRGVLAPNRRLVAATVLLAVTAAGAGIGLLAVAGWLIASAALAGVALGFDLFAPSALVRGLSFARILSRYGEKVVGHDLALRLVADVRDRLFRRLARAAPAAGGPARLGEAVSRVLAEVDALDALFTGVAGPLAATLGAGTALAATLLRTAPAAGCLYLLGYAAALALPALMLATGGRRARDLLAAKARLRTLVLDATTGHADLMAFGRRRSAEAAVAAAAAEIARLERWRTAVAAGAAGLAVLLAGCTALGVFIVSLGRFGGPWSVGLTLAVAASFEPAAALIRCVDRAVIALAAAARMDGMIRADDGTAGSRSCVPLPEGSDLALDSVCFSRHAGRPIFTGAGVHCAAGSRTAILGESGCGKSTLFDLVLRLVDPHRGAVRIGGVDIATVAPDHLHALVAVMAQGAPVFLGTIRDNLLLGHPEADDAACWDALRRARLDDAVAAMPEGLDTWCGEGGRTLSGGEARRLCLARTLLTGAAILLLDEPTAGLDAAEERRFFEDLAGAVAGRTVLLATHAAPPPGCFDKVLRIADGHFVDSDGEDAA